MSNIKIIKSFLIDEHKDKLIINQLSDHIGQFYINLVYHFCEKLEIKVVNDENFIEKETQNLFSDKKIYIYQTKNKKSLEKILEMDDKIIIISEYKVFKEYAKKILSINGYNYIKDITYYIKEELKIDNLSIVEFCVNNPYLAFSEISKYLINSNGYVSDTNITEKNDFILNLRKQLFNLKRNNRNIRYIYENIKKEATYNLIF